MTIEAGKVRETILTEVDVHGVAAAFVEACWRVNMRPTHDLIIMLLAQSALETGHWKVMRNYNFGNVKGTGGWIAGGGDVCFYEASENLNTAQMQRALAQAKPRTDGVTLASSLERHQKWFNGSDMEVRGVRKDGRHVCWFWSTHVQARFRSFDTLADGASAYVAKLLGRYAVALAWAQAGNVEKYVEALHAKGYFTAGLAAYTRTVRILFKRYWKTPIELSDVAEHLGNEVHGSRSGTWITGSGDWE